MDYFSDFIIKGEGYARCQGTLTNDSSGRRIGIINN